MTRTRLIEAQEGNVTYWKLERNYGRWFYNWRSIAVFYDKDKAKEAFNWWKQVPNNWRFSKSVTIIAEN